MMFRLFHDLPFNIPDAKGGEVLTASSARHKRAAHTETESSSYRQTIQCLTKTFKSIDPGC